MEVLTAEQMGFRKDLVTTNLSVALRNGYPVGNVGDVSPAIQKVASQKGEAVVYRTYDSGKTWQSIGKYKLNKMGGWEFHHSD